MPLIYVAQNLQPDFNLSSSFLRSLKSESSGSTKSNQGNFGMDDLLNKQTAVSFGFIYI